MCVLCKQICEPGNQQIPGLSVKFDAKLREGQFGREAKVVKTSADGVRGSAIKAAEYLKF